MNSPLAKIILATIGGYLLIFLMLSAYDWYVEKYPSRPAKPAAVEPIQHPLHHQQAAATLDRFYALPGAGQDALKKSLESCILSVDLWLDGLKQSDCRVLCLGEQHEESTRDFLTRKFFPGYPADSLLLEATPGELQRIFKRLDAGRDYFPLLGADILVLLRAAKSKNPGIFIHGIEQTKDQHKQSGESRDKSVAHNFWQAFHPGKRHVILFGAQHCSNKSDLLYDNLRNQALPALQKQMLNAWVLGEHQNGPLEGFVYFLDEIGIQPHSFVIPNTSALPPRIHDWFPALESQVLEMVRAVVVIRG